MKQQVLTREQFNENIVEIDQTRPIGFDVETNGMESWHPSSRLVGLSIAGLSKNTGTVEGFMVPLAHKRGINAAPDLLPAIIEFLINSRIVPFYVQMEATWAFAKMGIKPQFSGDAYIAARILQMKEAGLKDLTEKVLNRKPLHLEDVLGKGNFDFSEADPQSQTTIDYQIADAVNGLQLEMTLGGKVRSNGMGAVYELELDTAVQLAYASYLGYEVDLKLLLKELALYEGQVNALQEEIFSDLGVAPFTINSGAQLGKVLKLKGMNSPLKTDKGAESWSQDALQMLILQQLSAGKMDDVTLLKKIIKWKSDFSTANSLRHRSADAQQLIDGKIRPTWKPIGFDGTSRIYGENPSPTSLPKAARRAFAAPAGKRWFKFDWKQAEVRILAFLSGDQALKAIFDSGVDYHCSVYAGMSGVDIATVTPEQREISKILTYSVLYSGGNPYHVAQQLGIPIPEAVEKVKAYFKLFPTLEQHLINQRARAIDTHHVKTYMNRSRRLEGKDDQKLGDQACNSLGQQSCGTLLKVALNKIWSVVDLQASNTLKGFCQPIPVFDAVFYCIDANVPVEPHVNFMKSIVELELGDIKLEADFEMGDTWGEMQKVELPLPVAS